MARIEVSRRSGAYTDAARKYKVMVDGEEVGLIGAGGNVSAEVGAGEHELQIKIDWCRSKPRLVQLGEADTAAFECWPNSSPLKALWYISFGMADYVALEPLAAGASQPEPATAAEPPPPPPA